VAVADAHSRGAWPGPHRPVGHTRIQLAPGRPGADAARLAGTRDASR
jgi:hypothetical protein